MTTILGIDPGMKGAIAVLNQNDGLIDASRSVDIDSFKDLCRIYTVAHAIVEKAQTMPKQGIVSAFNYGTGYGKIIGWLEYAMIPYTLVAPILWTKTMHRGVAGKDAKARSREAFKRLYPGYELSKNKAKDEGLVDAALIGIYGMRHILHHVNLG